MADQKHKENNFDEPFLSTLFLLSQAGSRRRREGIQMAFQLYKDAFYQREILHLISFIASSDKDLINRNIAGSFLRDVGYTRLRLWINKSHVIVVECTNGHTNFYAREEIFHEKIASVWRLLENEESNKDEIILICKACSDHFAFKINQEVNNVQA